MTPAELEAWLDEVKKLKYLYERAAYHKKPYTLRKLKEARLAKHTWYGLEENNLRIKIDALLTDSSVLRIINEQH